MGGRGFLCCWYLTLSPVQGHLRHGDPSLLPHRLQSRVQAHFSSHLWSVRCNLACSCIGASGQTSLVVLVFINNFPHEPEGAVGDLGASYCPCFISNSCCLLSTHDLRLFVFSGFVACGSIIGGRDLASALHLGTRRTVRIACLCPTQQWS